MTTIVAVVGVAIILIVATFALNAIERGRQRAIAAQREPMSAEDFVQGLMQGGVSRETAEFLLSEVAPWYVAPLTPQPDDRLDSVPRIDGDHMGDIAEAFCERFGLPIPSGRAPVEMPINPTMAEFGLWLDAQRAGRAV